MDFVLIFLLLVIFIASIYFDDGEKFLSYMRPIHALPYSKSRYYRRDYVPLVVLPPGYTDINLTYKNSKTGIPIINSNDYCSENPHCYPCPNWKYIGHPMCSGFSNKNKK